MKAICTSEQQGSIPCGSTSFVKSALKGFSMNKLGFASSMLLLSLLLCLGCSNPNPSGQVVKTNDKNHSKEEADFLQPPQFDLGDTVSVEDTIKVGIVVDCVRSPVEGDYIWIYSVMFQNNTIKYTEEKLILIEAFDWGRPAKQGIVD